MGQPCIFVARGWLIDVANLERFRKRAHLQTAPTTKSKASTRTSRGRQMRQYSRRLEDDESEDEDVDQLLDFSPIQRLQSTEAQTNHLPPEVRCILLPTTLNHTITASSDLETLRALLHHTSVLFHSFFDRDVYELPSRPSSSTAEQCLRNKRNHLLHHSLSHSNPGNHELATQPYRPPHKSFRPKRATDYRTLDTSYDLTLSALQHLRQGKYATAGNLLDQAFSGLNEVVTSDHPNGISVVIKIVGACVNAGFGEVGGMVLRFVGELARVRFRDGEEERLRAGSKDPRGTLYALLPRIFEGAIPSGTKLTQEVVGGERMLNSGIMDAQSHLVSVYELFCQDLWRKKRPEGALLVLLWYPSLFCW